MLYEVMYIDNEGNVYVLKEFSFTLQLKVFNKCYYVSNMFVQDLC